MRSFIVTGPDGRPLPPRPGESVAALSATLAGPGWAGEALLVVVESGEVYG